jgi:hypothetical protein
MRRSAHNSGCRLARGLRVDVHPDVSAPAVTGPKVQRHDGAGVGPARSAARGPACSRAAQGPARGAARVSPKKPSRSRPVVRPGCGPSIVLRQRRRPSRWYSSIDMSQQLPALKVKLHVPCHTLAAHAAPTVTRHRRAGPLGSESVQAQPGPGLRSMSLRTRLVPTRIGRARRSVNHCCPYGQGCDKK